MKCDFGYSGNCSCEKRVGHEGPHACKCGGAWSLDSLEIIEFPMVAVDDKFVPIGTILPPAPLSAYGLATKKPVEKDPRLMFCKFDIHNYTTRWMPIKLMRVKSEGSLELLRYDLPPATKDPKTEKVRPSNMRWDAVPGGHIITHEGQLKFVTLHSDVEVETIWEVEPSGYYTAKVMIWNEVVVEKI